ncbi:MAG: hypothetical protein ACI8QS_003034 [Planctomycetota bacterium]|jgi:hypothetical protein
MRCGSPFPKNDKAIATVCQVLEAEAILSDLDPCDVLVARCPETILRRVDASEDDFARLFLLPLDFGHAVRINVVIRQEAVDETENNSQQDDQRED